MGCDPAFVAEQTTWGSVGGRSAGSEQKITPSVRARAAVVAAPLKIVCLNRRLRFFESMA